MFLGKNSIRWRIQRWHGLLLVLLTAIMSTGFFFYEKTSRKKKIAAEMSYFVSALIPRVLPPDGRILRQEELDNRHRRGGPQTRSRPPREGDEAGTRPLPRRLPPGLSSGDGGARPLEEILADSDFYYVVWDSQESIALKSDDTPDNISYPKETLRIAETVVRTVNGNMEAVHAVPNGAKIAVGIPERLFHQSMWKFGLMLAGLSAGLVATGVLVGWILLGKETREISNIADAAGRIAHGNLSERIRSEESGTELSNLAEVLNNTFNRLERSFEQQVRFTADASHELRTPLTAILTRCQLTLSKDRSPEKYKESMASCLDAAHHMKKLVESLLDLSRLDSGEAALNIQDTSLREIVTDSLELLSALAEKKFIEIDAKLDRFPIQADAARIQQVCINLVSNAIKYSPPGSKIDITVSKVGSTALLVVADQGPGIPEEDLPNIFNRFYRGNNGMQPGKDSCGLGLAVARAIVAAHHGSIHAANRSSGGALFRIELPA